MGSSGKRFGLATPVTRGRFSDPDFEAKAQQIREYWQSMTGSPDSHGRSHLTRVPVNSTLGTADQASRWLETSAAPRIRRGLLRMLKIVLPVAFLVALPFTVRDAGPAWAAHLGHGRPGIFTAYAESCNRTCTWYGTFTTSDGFYQNGLQLADGGNISKIGAPIAAIDVGSHSEVYPAGGGPDWIYVSALLALEGVAGIYLVVSLLGEIRRRRISPRPVSPRP